jgi:hypothetical protein
MKNQYAEAIQQEIKNLLFHHPELEHDDVLRHDMLEGVTGMQEFLTMVVREIDDAKALRDGTKSRLDELKARRDRFERRYQSLRELIRRTLEIANLHKFEMPEATLALRQSDRKVVGYAEAQDLPDDLCRIKRELDLEKIKKALLEGNAIDGLALSNGGSVLSIHIR